MVFPSLVAEYSRVGVARYDSASLDMSAGYNLIRPPRLVAATVYVHPAPSLLSIGSPPQVVTAAREKLTQSEFNRSKQEILQSHPSAKVLRETETSLSKGGRLHMGWKATFEIDGASFGLSQKVTSHLYLFSYLGEKWTVKYRFTYPKDFDGAKDIEMFLKTLEWTFK